MVLIQGVIIRALNLTLPPSHFESTFNAATALCRPQGWCIDGIFHAEFTKWILRSKCMIIKHKGTKQDDTETETTLPRNGSTDGKALRRASLQSVKVNCLGCSTKNWSSEHRRHRGHCNRWRRLRRVYTKVLRCRRRRYFFFTCRRRRRCPVLLSLFFIGFLPPLEDGICMQV